MLDIFFEALNYEAIEQKKAYDLAGLLGDSPAFPQDPLHGWPSLILHTPAPSILLPLISSPCCPVPSCSPVTMLSPSILQPCHRAVTLHPAALALLSGLSPNGFAWAVQQLLVTSSLSSSPGDIGGQMGLFIGASILTILEILDYIYEVL